MLNQSVCCEFLMTNRLILVFNKSTFLGAFCRSFFPFYFDVGMRQSKKEDNQFQVKCNILHL